ncbi:hypothetical protein QFZ77_004561 [Paenibacillus sp. V4I3]|nr:hypothetical protein [Paenibacillus sp. V4I3]
MTQRIILCSNHQNYSKIGAGNRSERGHYAS